MIKHYALETFMDVARPILTKAGAKAKASLAAKAATSASQQDASKSEPKGATAAPIAHPQPAGVGALPKFRDDYRAKFGQLPDDRTEVAFLTKRFNWDAHVPA